jgi:hypothetical protein
MTRPEEIKMPIKPRHATTTSRPVSMLPLNYNTNSVIDVRRRW